MLVGGALPVVWEAPDPVGRLPEEVAVERVALETVPLVLAETEAEAEVEPEERVTEPEETDPEDEAEAERVDEAEEAAEVGAPVAPWTRKGPT